MLILLPPSEGKTPPRDPSSPPVDPSSLVLPELAPERIEVMRALVEVSSSDAAQEVLKVGARVMPEVRANSQLFSAPTAPAHEVYTGVLYEALEAHSLSAAQLGRAAEQVLVFSGLFGVTSLCDHIPAYRLSMGISLSGAGTGSGPGAAVAAPRPGRLGSFWKAALAAPLDAAIGGQLVVDCRSSAYAQAYRASAEQTLVVNSFTEQAGARKVVTHFAKHARGKLARMLLRAPQAAQPESVEEVAELAAQHWRVELRPATGRTPHQLDLID